MAGAGFACDKGVRPGANVFLKIVFDDGSRGGVACIIQCLLGSQVFGTVKNGGALFRIIDTASVLAQAPIPVADIVLIHDGIRPNVSQEIISGCIAQCRMNGSAVTVIPCAEAMLLRETDPNRSKEVISRDSLARTQTPQAFPLGKLCWAHKEALKRGITNSVATCTLMIELGEEVHFCAGSEKNVKITTVEDIDIFKALLLAKRDDWLK